MLNYSCNILALIYLVIVLKERGRILALCNILNYGHFMSNFRDVYLILFSLYWAQGLPVGFMTHALPVILRAEGVSLAHIGGFGLLMLPWSIKILWAPLIDRYGSLKQGHYRSWIIPTQILTIITLVILAFLPIQSLNQPLYLFIFFIVLMSMNIFGATQDIATDGLAVNILKEHQQHWGNMIQVIGSRLGFIVGGGVILWILDALNWQVTFLLLAVLVTINTIPILLYKESEYSEKQTSKNQKNKRTQIQDYLRYFFQSKTLKLWLFVLLTFKVADGLSGPLLKPLMVDLGLSFTQIGLYITVLGAIAALFGAGLAGIILKFYTIAPTLIIFSIFKVMSLWAYVWLAYQYESKTIIANWVIYSINAVEDMVSSMLLVAMLTLILKYSRKTFAATDFTFQVALMATMSGVLYSISGFIGDVLGYFSYLFIISLIAIVCLIPIVYWSKNSNMNDK